MVISHGTGHCPGVKHCTDLLVKQCVQLLHVTGPQS